MDEDTLGQYLDRMHDVEGWFAAPAATLFARIDTVQDRLGIRGDLFEIGVHHGKSAGLLALMARFRERVGVCDLFGSSPNPSGSGSGEHDAFVTWIGHWLTPPTELRIHAKRSAELRLDDTGVTCRFVHIDGGHSAAETMTDLATGSRALLEDGVVAIDDVFNARWPGVVEGLSRYLLDHPLDLVPFAAGFNKVLLCRPVVHDRYLAHLQDSGVDPTWRSEFRVTSRGWFGWSTLLYEMVEG